MPLILVFLISWAAFAQNYTISTFAGAAPPTNIPGTSAVLGAIYGVATDSSGNVFLATDSAVQRLDAKTGLLTVVAGNGTIGYSGDGGPATSAQLNFPDSLAVDSAGDLYICDSNNNVIRKVSNGIITTVAGGGNGGDDGPAVGAYLSGPSGIALDSAGNLYIADTFDYVVRKVSNGIITTVAGNGYYGFSGDNGPATKARLTTPTSVKLDSAGNLYIADFYNYRIRVVSTTGIITTVAGNGNNGFSGDNGPATTAELSGIEGVAVDSAGNLYITDTFNNRIRQVSKGIITTFAGNGTAGASGDNGPATSAEMSLPIDITVDPAGNVYVADNGNSRIRKVSKGVITTAAGNATYGYSGDTGPVATAQLIGPFGIAMDSAGNTYIADNTDNRVRKLSGGTVTTVAGSALTGFAGDNGPATSASLSQPLGIAVDSAGDLYIADAANNRVRKVSNGVITTVAGNGELGEGDGGYNGDNIPAISAELNFPTAVAVDSAGNLYIADSVNNRVRQVSTSGVITTVAGNGTFGYSGDNGPATSAELAEPVSIALDSTGNLYIACVSSIRKVSNGIITTVAGIGGSLGDSGDNGPAISAQLGFPNGIALDPDGNLFISDVYLTNNRIRKVSGGVITTIAGGATAGFSGDSGPATSSELNYPANIAIDPAGNVYFADYNNNRIRLLTPPAASSSCSYWLTSNTVQSPATGGSFIVAIATDATCQWVISGLPSWITLSGANSGTGPKGVTLTIPPNNYSAPLTATISVAGIPVTVTEAASATASGLVIMPNGVSNAAGFQTGIVPGSIITIFCSNLGVPAGQTLTASGNTWPPQIGGISVYMNGLTAPVYSVLNQNGYQLVSVQAPWELATATSATVTVVTGAGASISPPVTVPVLLAQPGIFLLDGASSGATHLDGSIVNVSNPAAPGESVVLYLTGLGEVYHQPATGTAASLTTLSRTVLLPQVTMGGAVTATPVFSGLAPGDIGTYQIDVTVPTTGLSGLLNLTVQMNGVTSNIATIAVQ